MADPNADRSIIWCRTTCNIKTSLLPGSWISRQFIPFWNTLPQLDIDKHNAQDPPITVRTFSKAHDRFLIIDDTVYLIGASIKDLGKKWFGFTLLENTDAEDLLGRI